MTATIINETVDGLTLQVVIPFNRSMIEAENTIQDALNEAGILASANFLHRFDPTFRRSINKGDNISDKGHQKTGESSAVRR